MSPVSFKPIVGFQGTWDSHISEQQNFLLEGIYHWNCVAACYEERGNPELAQFCRNVAQHLEKGWDRVTRRLNPFGHSGLEDDIPESACSGAHCELKQAGIEVSELMGTKS